MSPLTQFDIFPFPFLFLPGFLLHPITVLRVIHVGFYKEMYFSFFWRDAPAWCYIFPITNLSLTIIIVVFIVRFYFNLVNFNNWVHTKLFINIFRTLYEIPQNLLIQNVGISSLSFLPIIFVLFFSILFFNLLGLLPYFFTVTSHLSISLFLSGCVFLGVTILSLRKWGLRSLAILLPRGAPKIISFFIIPIEIVSYVARVFSLGVRLFANMMAGHTLSKILGGYSWSLIYLVSSGFLFLLFPWCIFFIVVLLEIIIAILQAYVFVTLSCIYLNDSLKPLH